MNRLIGDVAFAQLVRDRYFALRESYLSENYIFNYIDSAAQVLNEAQGRHFTRWRILGINVGAPETDEQPTTFDGEMEKFKHWISTRLHWLDNNIPGIVVTDLPEDAPVGPITIFPNPASEHINITARSSIQNLTIYAQGRMQKMILAVEPVNQKMIDISDFPPGVYILTAILEDGTFWTGKFVKTD
jgi:hypothetical protein